MEESKKSEEVGVASGVGHLTDPTTVDTSGMHGKDAKIGVSSPEDDKKTAGAPTTIPQTDKPTPGQTGATGTPIPGQKGGTTPMNPNLGSTNPSLANTTQPFTPDNLKEMEKKTDGTDFAEQQKNKPSPFKK